MVWKSVERPGYFGKSRDEIFRQYNERFGEGKWRLMWFFGGITIPFKDNLLIDVCSIYEDAYFIDSFRKEGLWTELCSKAKNVYDIEEKDIESGFDYRIQSGPATHIQDISIRRVVFRRGWGFKGNDLMQIRGSNNYFSKNLNPGKVIFHLLDKIIQPHLEGWWDKNSAEDFYQSNKILQVLD